MYGPIYIREPAPRPQYKWTGVASPLFASTSTLRLDLVLWYTSGFK